MSGLKPGQFLSPEDIWQCLTFAVVTTWRCYWNLVGRGWDAAECHVCTGQPSATKNYLAYNFSSAKVEKFCSRERKISLNFVAFLWLGEFYVWGIITSLSRARPRISLVWLL